MGLLNHKSLKIYAWLDVQSTRGIMTSPSRVVDVDIRMRTQLRGRSVSNVRIEEPFAAEMQQATTSPVRKTEAFSEWRLLNPGEQFDMFPFGTGES